MKSLKQHAQAGFTLIELVIVIVILGILAATALPRFFDVTTDARKAAVAAVTSGFSTGSSMEHAKWLVDGSVPGSSPAACVAPNAANGVTGTCAAGTSATIEGTIVGFNAFGYPVSADAAPTLTPATGVMTMTDATCVSLWSVVLASGRPTIDLTSVLAASGGKDWAAVASGTAAPFDSCTFNYHGNNKLASARNFIYDQKTGSVTSTNN